MRLSVFLSCATLLLLSIAYGDELKDTKFGFKMTIPDGFKGVGKGDNPDNLYLFTDGEPGPGKTPLVIIIQRMRGTIAIDSHTKPSDIPLPPGAKATIETFKWNGIALDLSRLVCPLPTGGAYVIYGVQYPLPKEAVQFQMGGPEANDAALRKLFEKVADSFVSLEGVKS